MEYFQKWSIFDAKRGARMGSTDGVVEGSQRSRTWGTQGASQGGLLGTSQGVLQVDSQEDHRGAVFDPSRVLSCTGRHYDRIFLLSYLLVTHSLPHVSRRLSVFLDHCLVYGTHTVMDVPS
jgi:hypothetical protein